MAQEFDLLVAGEINPDLILSGPGLEPRFGQQEVLVETAALTIGSSSAIFACGAARLGLRVAFIGICGEDIFGKYMLESLAERGVDVRPVIVDPAQHTGLSVILNRGTDRAILTHMGSIAALHAGQVSDAWLTRARHLHVASYFLQTGLQVGLPDLFWRARSLGLTTSLDPNWDPAGEWRGLTQALEHTTIFFPNEAEVLALTQASDAAAAVRVLSTQALVVVKLGAQGAIALQGDLIARAAALHVPLVDSVGAGDSFDAGFIYGYLNNWSLEASLKLAVACGSLSTRASGGTAGQPTLTEAMQAAGMV
jgi:sugar/nucleoside kinase (ribokinase family)